MKWTLLCLSKLYPCVNDKVFQAVAHSSVEACIGSLQKASTSISDAGDAKSTALDGALFLVKQLLVLREQIAPFDVAFVSTEKTLNVSATNMLSDLARIVEESWTEAVPDPLGSS